MDISSTLSNTGSKQTVLEESSITFASLEEAKRRENDAISNERIKKGDLILDTYEVTSDAISGGMGSVWRVHHRSWNTDLAMKRPQPKYFAEGSGKRKEQFIAECENWINLGLHPNIVSCYYVREIGGVPSIFSEWMDGGSLKDRIQDGSLYEGTDAEVQERILNIAIQAARGLQYSHDNLLIHQDMKPGNLLLSKGWDAKVADFGLAKAKEQLNDPSETAKTTGYTLAYCPKEQSDGEEPARWMDVYAWALTVLEMYAGKRLWNTGAEAKDHFDEYPSQCAHTIPDGMTDVLRSCLRDQPDGFADIDDRLIAVYRDVTGAEYSRRNAKATDSAGSLNNRALSFIDLEKFVLAEECWKKALELNRDSYESIFNRALSRWRRGETSVTGAKEMLKDIRDTAVREKYLELLDKEYFGHLKTYCDDMPDTDGIKWTGFTKDKNLVCGLITEGLRNDTVIKGVLYDLKKNKTVFSKPLFYYGEKISLIRYSSDYRLSFYTYISVSDDGSRVMTFEPQKMKWSVYSVADSKLLAQIPGFKYQKGVGKEVGVYSLSHDGVWAACVEKTDYTAETHLYNVNTGEVFLYISYQFHGFTYDNRMLMSAYVNGEKTEPNGQVLVAARRVIFPAVPGQELPLREVVQKDPGILGFPEEYVFWDEDHTIWNMGILPGDTAAKLFEAMQMLSKRGLQLKSLPDKDTKFFAALNDGRYLLTIGWRSDHGEIDHIHGMIIDSATGQKLDDGGGDFGSDLQKGVLWLDKKAKPADYTPGEKAEYLLSVIESTVTRLEKQDEFDKLLKVAEDAYHSGEALQAVRLIDKAMALSGFEASYDALKLRAQYGADLQKTGVRDIIQLSVPPEGEVDDGYLSESELSRFSDAVKEIKARLREQLYDYVGNDICSVEKRFHVNAEQYSRDDRYLIVSTSMAEVRDSPASFDVETTYWFGASIINTATGEIEYYNDSIMKHDNPWVVYPTFELHINNDGSRYLLLTDEDLSIYDVCGGEAQCTVNVRRRYTTASFLEDDHYVLCLDKLTKNVIVLDSMDGSHLFERKMQFEDQCYAVTPIDNDCFEVKKTVCRIVWDYEPKKAEEAPAEIALEEPEEEISLPAEPEQEPVSQKKELPVTEEKERPLTENTVGKQKKKGFFAKLFGKKN